MIVRPDYDVQNPGEVEFFGMDFANVLAAGETIASASVTLTDINGIDTGAQSHVIGTASISGTKVTQKLSGLLAGCYYLVLFTVITSAGQTIELYSRVRCETPS